MSTTNSTAREGDLDRNASEALDQAEVFIEQFSDPVTLSPRFEIDPTNVVASYSEQNRVPAGQALRLYRSGLKALATGQRTRFDSGRVSLDLDGLAGGRTWSVPGPVRSMDEKGNEFTDEESVIPQVVFCSLSLDSALYVPFEAEAIAIHYLPSRKVVTKTRQADGVPYQVSDDYSEAGYLGIARIYRSVDDAMAARDELVDAVRTYGRGSASARQDDVFEVEARKAPTSMPSII